MVRIGHFSFAAAALVAGALLAPAQALPVAPPSSMDMTEATNPATKTQFYFGFGAPIPYYGYTPFYRPYRPYYRRYYVPRRYYAPRRFYRPRYRYR